MGLYNSYVLPRLIDKMASRPEMEPLRKEAVAPARGRVLEIGFGSGLNIPHYPKAVERIVGLDPNPGVEKLARSRISAASIPIEFRIGSGESLPFPDGSFDTVVTTYVLCTIDDVQGALHEIRRVLAPDGRYAMLEHGLAQDVNVQKWQRRLNSFNMMMLGHCRLNRPISRLVTDAGFQFEGSREFFSDAAPRFAGWTTCGCAVRATSQ